jgi:hypothetical protein
MITVGPKQRRERERQTILQAALEIASEERWQAVTIRHAWISPSSSGTVNQKVEPRPGALSTPTCP